MQPSWRDVDYDPRLRDWYKGTENAPTGSIAWTNPYIFFTTRELGITASGAWLSDGVRYVIAWDVLLNSVTAFTTRLAAELSPRSSIVVMTPDKRVIGLPRHQAYLEPDSWAASFLKPVVDLAAPETRALMASAKGMDLPASIRFDAGGFNWWAGLREYRIAPDRAFEIAVLVPDVDLLHNLHRQRIIILSATTLALLAALAFSLILARSYSRPLEELARQSRKIRALDFSPNEPVRADIRELRELANTQAQSFRALQSFSRYVPTEVVSELVKTNEVAQIGGQSREITVLFTDIAGFTAIAENATPDALAEHLAVYFEAMIDALHRHGATVDKLIGDSIMAFWGAPRRDIDHRRNAVQGVLECRRELRDLNDSWRKQGRIELPTRFGLATGTVLVGNFGAPNRLAYTVFGDTVNLASRLEGLNKLYGTDVLADERVLERTDDNQHWRRLDRVRVKGRSAPVWIYELLPEGFDPRAASEYARAWDAYANADFESALEILSSLRGNGADPVVDRLRALCVKLASSSLPIDWDPVTDIDQK
jgi:adenylate cyclase